jgi:DNA-binding LytR/AlgR family response regulator
MAEDWPQQRAFPLLVFITAYEQYALQAFERAALDYVLKPVLPERLALTCGRLQAALALRQKDEPEQDQQAKNEDKLERAVEQLRLMLSATAAPSAAPVRAQQPPLRMLQISQGQVIQMLPVDEVLYFEAADKYVRVLTPGKEHLMRISLRELLPQLDADRFWQIHRSVLVRSDAIDRAVRDEAGKLTLHLHGSKDRLTVSRMYTHLFKGM